MKIRVLSIGKTKDANLSRLISDYTSRIEKFLPLEVIETKEPHTEESRRVQLEGEKLLASIDVSDRIVVLDPAGKLWKTHDLVEFFSKHMSNDPRRLTFVIGGPNGLADSVKKRGDVLWSLSPLTFTHDLCRVLLLEQIYRALTIIHNHPYSK